MIDEQLKYKIGLGLIEGVGDITAKKLIAYCGGVKAIFKESKRALNKIPGIGTKLVDAIKNQQVFDRAEEEIKFIYRNNITPLFYLDAHYPKRLKYCDDSPVMLYTKGKIDFNVQKVVSIVGTRNATQYGKKMCKKIVEGLIEHQVLIVSGLAYGIDIHAHKVAIENNLPTVAVVAHGLDRVYPPLHESIAVKMQQNGGIVTEFMSKTKPDKENFPQRNRIIAGLSDTVIVVESKKRGGALITAEIANSYNRDVFAIPGRLDDTCSEGCDWLIKTNKAALFQSVKDLEYLMGWELKKIKKPIQKKLFIDLSHDEKKVINIIKSKGQVDIDCLCHEAKMSNNQAATVLINLEFNGVVKSLPGKMYELN